MAKKVTIFQSFGGWRTSINSWVNYPTSKEAQKAADWYNKIKQERNNMLKLLTNWKKKDLGKVRKWRLNNR